VKSHVTSISKNTAEECLYDVTVSYTCRGNCGGRIVGEKAVVVWLVLLDMETSFKDVALECFPVLPGWNRKYVPSMSATFIVVRI
jgi:hypothetical protein